MGCFHSNLRSRSPEAVEITDRGQGPCDGTDHSSDALPSKTPDSSAVEQSDQRSSGADGTCLLDDGAGKDAIALVESCLPLNLGQFVEIKSGLLSERVKRTLSSVSNCSVRKPLESEAAADISLVLLDDETGEGIGIKCMIGEGGESRN